MNPDEQVVHFAKTNFRNEEKAFGIKAKDRKAHMYMVGKTGTGKSTTLLNMLVADMNTGNGIGLIDPHGDLAEEVLGFVPKERINDVIYFNPADTEHPIAFNPLENGGKEQNFLIASGLISVFKKIWYEYWGPRLEHILRNSILTLLECHGSTLLEIQRLLTNREFRRRIIERVRDPHLRDFWLTEFERYSPWVKSDAVSPILNKVGQFLASVPIRNIIGQRKSSFDLREMMDQQKIFIANLAKGRIGEDACRLLGAMLITKIELAALSRTDAQEEKRIPFYLYIDEIHSFLTLSFADILSEARKYGLALILAHQYIEQLDEKIRQAILGNVGTIISFRVGAQDARYLAQEFYPVFDESDLVNLPNYHIYLKLMIDGVTSRPFSAITLPPPREEVRVGRKSLSNRGPNTEDRKKESREKFFDLFLRKNP